MMKTLLKNLLFALGWILLAILGIVIYDHYQSQEEVTPERLKEGEAIFHLHCAGCHGPHAQGENPSKPMGGMKADGSYIAPALNGNGHSWHHPTDVLRRIVTEGSPAEGSSMKGFGQTLTTEQIMSVIHYFQSLWPEEVRKEYQKREAERGNLQMRPMPEEAQDAKPGAAP